MSSEGLKAIRKTSEIHMANGAIVDSLETSSTSNAPSIRAVNEALSNVNEKISSVYKYKGNVANFDALPSSGNTIGDVWNVLDNGTNYAWTGTEWDSLAGIVDLTDFYNKEQIDTKFDEVDNSLNGKLDKNVQFVDEGNFNDLIVVGKTTISVLRTFGNAMNAPLQIPEVYTVISNCSAVNGGTQLAITSTSRIFTRTYLGGNDWRNWVEYVSKNAFVLEGTTLKITM